MDDEPDSLIVEPLKVEVVNNYLDGSLPNGRWAANAARRADAQAMRKSAAVKSSARTP